MLQYYVALLLRVKSVFPCPLPLSLSLSLNDSMQPKDNSLKFYGKSNFQNCTKTVHEMSFSEDQNCVTNLGSCSLGFSITHNLTFISSIKMPIIKMLLAKISRAFQVASMPPKQKEEIPMCFCILNRQICSQSLILNY